MTGVTVRAPAKINLQLSVGPPRADGYHNLVTVFQAVSLYDEVTAADADGPGQDRVLVSGEGAPSVPAGPDNLALKAATALAQVSGLSRDPERHLEITIRKRIPVAAGLAGGSADAAAALVACNELWQAGLSSEQLSGIAAGVGSDVAFSLLGGTAVGQGRGERLSPALTSGEYHWVLAVADGQLSTPEVYRALDALRASASVPDAGTGATGPGALDNALMAALRAGDPAAVGRALSNDLQAPALSLFPALRKTLSAGQELGALGAIVAGSGPTCVFLAASAERAVDLAVALSGAGVCRAVARATGPVPGVTVVTAGSS
ncbi:MAG TPA: 4-(cytidine 5'-diphospho)-2-C-methyl-D-erythritol kinase [Streptosporangiaceae bacterium]|nr:4-(cytidine 5'-diphospho)-2-C-methyl-D-erythritol kinase [Streptosporangiaceae bacterium]